MKEKRYVGHVGYEKFTQTFSWKISREDTILRDVGLDGTIILNLVLRKCGVKSADQI
jgi:hypothetical protein